MEPPERDKRQRRPSPGSKEWGFSLASRGTVIGLSVRTASGIHPEERRTIEVTPEDGVIGDHGTSSRRQVTLLNEASWRAALAEIDREAPWTTRRANILVTGADLASALKGGQVIIGAVKLAINGETVPCDLMDSQVSGLSNALVPEVRGGVYGQVITGGTIAVGDELEVIEP